MKKVISILLIVLVSGCVTIKGAKIDNSKLSNIINGKTTSADVTKHLGKPTKVSTDPFGITKWEYNTEVHTYSIGGFSGLGNNKSSPQQVVIQFNNDNIVLSCSLSAKKSIPCSEYSKGVK